jgi:Uma2 family endonuclease
MEPATSQELIRLSPDARAEIIDGEVIKKASPLPEHGIAQLVLGAQLVNAFHRRSGEGPPGGWWLMTEVEVEYDPKQVYCHDLVGWRRERMPQRPAGRPVTSRPDWVCEILSPSNAQNDLVRKLRTLHRASVPHYWLVDPGNKTLTVLRFTPDGYLAALTAGGHDVVRAEPFDAIELELGRLFDEEG